MGQAEVLEFLKKNRPNWFTTRQISENTGVNQNTVNMNLRRLITWHEVQRKIVNGREHFFKYGSD